MDLARSPVAEVEATVLLPYVLSQFVVGGRRSLPVDSWHNRRKDRPFL